MVKMIRENPGFYFVSVAWLAGGERGGSVATRGDARRDYSD